MAFDVICVRTVFKNGWTFHKRFTISLVVVRKWIIVNEEELQGKNRLCSVNADIANQSLNICYLLEEMFILIYCNKLNIRESAMNWWALLFRFT